jgi:putative addiction module killer protein
MFRVERTVEFENWLNGLRDRMAQKRIVMRIRRIESGLLGDWKTLGNGVSELRIDHGPGYRLYYTMRQQVVIILLCGSSKSDQDKAIKRAQELSKSI